MAWEYHERKRTPRGTWEDERKTERLMIRISYADYELIRGRAYARGMSMSAYILQLIRADLDAMRAAAAPDGVSGGCAAAAAISTAYPQRKGAGGLSRGRGGLAQPLTAGTRYN